MGLHETFREGLAQVCYSSPNGIMGLKSPFTCNYGPSPNSFDGPIASIRFRPGCLYIILQLYFINFKSKLFFFLNYIIYHLEINKSNKLKFLIIE